jgi:N-carbamoylputrescine amidase
MEETKKLTVAAVQMVSENGDIEGNLERATGHVEEAARRGAALIVMPEFMPTGYVFTKEIWDAAEPAEGPTVRWLRMNSRAHGVWLGTSFLEAEGEDFFNTFLVTNPDGDIDGRVRKQTPAAFEAYFTRGEPGPHVIDTALGRLGVGICYENMLAYTPELMSSRSVDMLLMPHSAPTPTVSPIFPASAARMFNEFLGNVASYYASMLGVPAVFVNKSGPWVTPLPFLPAFLTQRSSFPGLSAIADSDGKVKAQLGDREGVIVEEVALDPARKTGACPPCHGRWVRKVPLAINQWRLVETLGAVYYRLSGERKRRAAEMSRSAA